MTTPNPGATPDANPIGNQFISGALNWLGGIPAFLDSVGKGVGDALNPGKNNLLSSVPGSPSLSQGSFDFTQRSFPFDLGDANSYNGHYMVININVQNETQYSQISTKSGQSFNLESKLPGVFSKTDTLRYQLDNNVILGNGQSAGTPQNFLVSRPRYTTRIKESIALYMPNSELTFTDVHDFENVSLTNFSASAIQGIGKLSAAAAIGAFGATGIVGSTIGAVGGILGAGGQLIGSVAQIAGTPINPKVEVLYANTFQRQFAFDFLFGPTNEKESLALQQIIRTLRFHAAPEIRPGVIQSYFFIPPSEFDLTFYNRGVENTAIPRINTCVLQQIDVSYSPTGVYSTFSNGYPVQVRMMLQFREVEIAHKLRILEGF